MDQQQATLELGTKPVGKLLVQYAIPAVIAMTASSLYNIIDRIFIGQVVGPLAISGLAITFPFMNLSAAFGAAIGVGSSTSISIKLGQKDFKTAENILGNTVTLNILISLIYGMLSLIFLDPILRFFGASDATLPYARDFMQIILAGNVITYMYFGMNALLRSSGKPKHAMYATMFTVAMNILLDSIFILWFKWGIRGAASATMISQTCAMIWQLTLFNDKKELLHFKRGIYRLKLDLVKLIVGIGISPFLINACASIVVIFMNNQFVKYGGDLAVGAYGIANSIGVVFVLFVMGINQGMQPIAGYNYGAMQLDRVMKVLYLSMIAGFFVMSIGWAIAMFLPYQTVSLFTTDPTLINFAVKGVRIDMLLYPLVGLQIVITNFFQCIGKVKVSIFLSLSRQLIFLLPLLFVLPPIFGITGVWATLPASDFIAVFVALAILAYNIKKFKLQHKSAINERQIQHDY